MQEPNHLPSIQKEATFEAEFKKITESFDKDKMLDFESSIDWALVRGPKYFSSLGENYFLWRFPPVKSGLPLVTIVYRYEEDKGMIYLLSVRTD